MTRTVNTDFLVIGSGAGALVSAITAAHHGAKVIVVEKSDRYGGTSAMSGGGVWIPNSSNAKKIGNSSVLAENRTSQKGEVGASIFFLFCVLCTHNQITSHRE